MLLPLCLLSPPRLLLIPPLPVPPPLFPSPPALPSLLPPLPPPSFSFFLHSTPSSGRTENFSSLQLGVVEGEAGQQCATRWRCWPQIGLCLVQVSFVCPPTLASSIHPFIKHLLLCVRHTRPGLEDPVIIGFSPIQQTIIKHLLCARPLLGSPGDLVSTSAFPALLVQWGDTHGTSRTTLRPSRAQATFANAGPSLHEKKKNATNYLLQLPWYHFINFSF